MLPRHATPLHPGAAASWGRALTPEAVAMPPRAWPVRRVPGAERLVAVSDVSASTPAKAPPTPAGLAVEVAVLNLGLPTTNPPVRNEEATRET